jgi:hypothetical protein
MTVKEVADRFNELAQEYKYGEIQNELFGDDCESIEPDKGEMGLPSVKGIEAIKEKGEKFNAMVEEMHGGWCTEPVIGGPCFSVGMGMDVTFKGAGRVNMEEIAVYEVKDGKIVKEQFFY